MAKKNEGFNEISFSPLSCGTVLQPAKPTLGPRLLSELPATPVRFWQSMTIMALRDRDQEILLGICFPAGKSISSRLLQCAAKLNHRQPKRAINWETLWDRLKRPRNTQNTLEHNDIEVRQLYFNVYDDCLAFCTIELNSYIKSYMNRITRLSCLRIQLANKS